MNSRERDMSAGLDYLLVDVLRKEVQVSELKNSECIDEPSASRVSPSREWLSYAETSELVGLGRTTLWKLVGAGEIEVARVGRAVRINRKSLTAYMKRSAGDRAVAAE
jgi:excisionase family DNA binding protein